MEPRERFSLPWSVDKCRRGGHFYLGRRPMRSGVTFSDSEGKACLKENVASKDPSPGVVAATCTCGHPAVLGVSLLVRVESLSIISTVLLRYFPRVKTVYYDAACNLFICLTSRFSWFIFGFLSFSLIFSIRLGIRVDRRSAP